MSEKKIVRSHLLQTYEKISHDVWKHVNFHNIGSWSILRPKLRESENVANSSRVKNRAKDSLGRNKASIFRDNIWGS